MNTQNSHSPCHSYSTPQRLPSTPRTVYYAQRRSGPLFGPRMSRYSHDQSGFYETEASYHHDDYYFQGGYQEVVDYQDLREYFGSHCYSWDSQKGNQNHEESQNQVQLTCKDVGLNLTFLATIKKVLQGQTLL